LYRRLGGLQGCSGWLWKILLPPGFDPCTIQPAVSHFTDYAVLASILVYNISEFWGHDEQNIILVAVPQKKVTEKLFALH